MAVDTTYTTGIYTKDNGNTMVVADGGAIEVQSGGTFRGPNPSGGTDYYVDGNTGSDSNDGLSWGNSMLTVATAMAASHTNIAAGSTGWAARNRIFIKGDDFVEDFVAVAQKTDIIGVGSSDNYAYACIRGNHTPVNTAVGCRFYNVRFRPTASTDCWTLTSSTGGIEFHNCYYEAAYSTFTFPSAIDSTGCARLRVMNCQFSGVFSSNYIDIGAGDATGIEIAYNEMTGGADNGIMVTGTATIGAGHMGKIHHNFVQCADKVIDTQATSVFNVYDNVMISGEALGASSYVIDLTFACRNAITGNDVSVYVPSLTTVA